MMKIKCISQCLIVILIILFLISLGNNTLSTRSSKLIEHPNFDNNKLNSRANTSDDADFVFLYNDISQDVWKTENVKENYTTSSGFDIKSISGELENNSLWLNMTMHDFVNDNEEMYYKIFFGNAEVIFYRGDGSISFSDGTTEFSVWYTTKSISANINLDLLSDNMPFAIRGEIKREDKNDEYGEFVIRDEMSGDVNGLEFYLQDPIDDVKILYSKSNTVNDEPEIDILRTTIEDVDTTLTIIVKFRGVPGSLKNSIYSIELGEVKFEYHSSGGLTIIGDFPQNGIEVNIKSNSIFFIIEKKEMEILDSYLKISSKYEPSGDLIYMDVQEIDLPEYLHYGGQWMDLEVTMFEDNQIVFIFQDELNVENSIKLRSIIDAIGNYNYNVEENETDNFIKQLNNDFSTKDFFELYPIIDSVPGEPSLEFEFQNVTGAVDDNTPITQSVISRWQFAQITQEGHNITFRFFPTKSKIPESLAFAFQIVYENVHFKLSNEYKYWEISPSTVFPTQYRGYLSQDHRSLLIPELEYYVLKDRYEEHDFGFNIEYNETLVKKDKDKKNDDDGGFIPGFGGSTVIVGLIIIAILYFNSKKKF